MSTSPLTTIQKSFKEYCGFTQCRFGEKQKVSESRLHGSLALGTGLISGITLLTDSHPFVTTIAGLATVGFGAYSAHLRRSERAKSETMPSGQEAITKENFTQELDALHSDIIRCGLSGNGTNVPTAVARYDDLATAFNPEMEKNRIDQNVLLNCIQEILVAKGEITTDNIGSYTRLLFMQIAKAGDMDPNLKTIYQSRFNQLDRFVKDNKMTGEIIKEMNFIHQALTDNSKLKLTGNSLIDPKLSEENFAYLAHNYVAGVRSNTINPEEATVILEELQRGYRALSSDGKTFLFTDLIKFVTTTEEEGVTHTNVSNIIDAAETTLAAAFSTMSSSTIPDAPSRMGPTTRPATVSPMIRPTAPSSSSSSSSSSARQSQRVVSSGISLKPLLRGDALRDVVHSETSDIPEPNFGVKLRHVDHSRSTSSSSSSSSSRGVLDRAAPSSSLSSSSPSPSAVFGSSAPPVRHFTSASELSDEEIGAEFHRRQDAEFQRRQQQVSSVYRYSSPPYDARSMSTSPFPSSYGHYYPSVSTPYSPPHGYARGMTPSAPPMPIPPPLPIPLPTGTAAATLTMPAPSSLPVASSSSSSSPSIAVSTGSASGGSSSSVMPSAPPTPIPLPTPLPITRPTGTAAHTATMPAPSLTLSSSSSSSSPSIPPPTMPSGGSSSPRGGSGSSVAGHSTRRRRDHHRPSATGSTAPSKPTASGTAAPAKRT